MLSLTSMAQLHVYMSVSVKSKAGDLQVHFSIFCHYQLWSVGLPPTEDTVPLCLCQERVNCI